MRRAVLSVCILFWLTAYAAAQIGIPFPGPGLVSGGGPPSATVFYNTGGSATNDAPGGATVTFTGIAIGTASADRYVACSEYGRSTGTVTASGMTIGGISATRLIQATNAATGTDLVDWWIANVTSGATANVVVTYNTTPAASYVGCLEIHNLLNAGASSATASATTNGGSMVLSTVPAGGIVIAASGDHTAGTTTWTNVTKNWDNTPSRDQSGASAAFSSAQVNLSVSGTISSVASPVFVAVSLR